MKKGSLRILMFILIVTAILLFFGIVLTLIVFLWIKWGNVSSEGEFEVTRKYRYITSNVKTNETSVGMMEIYDELGPEEFLSYQENDNYVLISHFDQTEFQCTGSCFCEDSRRMTTTIASGLRYLVAGIATYTAYSLSKEHFQEECAKTYQDQCPESSIRAEVQDCGEILHAKVLQFPGTKSEDDTSSKEEFQTSNENQGGRSYFCTGNCVVQDFAEVGDVMNVVYQNIFREFAVNFGCEALELKSEYNLRGLPPRYLSEYPSETEFVRKAWMQEMLHPFCTRNSHVNMASLVDSAFVVEKMETLDNLVACLAHIKEENDSVQCFEVGTGSEFIH